MIHSYISSSSFRLHQLLTSLVFAYSISSNNTNENNVENHGNVHVIKDRSDWNAKLQDATSNGKVVCHDYTHTETVIIILTQTHSFSQKSQTSWKH